MPGPAVPQRRRRVVLVCGLPGAGKTTRARRIAARTGAQRLRPDEWIAALGLDPYDAGARERVEALQWRLAEELVARGLSVVLENGFWTREERDGLRERARALGLGIELVVLDPPVEELWRRLSARNAAASQGTVPIARELFESYLPWWQPPDEAELALYDGPSQASAGR